MANKPKPKRAPRSSSTTKGTSKMPPNKPDALGDVDRRPGPVTNKRVRNKPFKPARAPVIQRGLHDSMDDIMAMAVREYLL